MEGRLQSTELLMRTEGREAEEMSARVSVLKDDGTTETKLWIILQFLFVTFRV